MCVIGKVLTISARTAFSWIGISLPEQPGPPERAVDRVVALALPTATRTPTIGQKVARNLRGLIMIKTLQNIRSPDLASTFYDVFDRLYALASQNAADGVHRNPEETAFTKNEQSQASPTCN